MTTPKPFDACTFCMAYEEGSLTPEEIISGFQHLIDTGLAWRLQGAYGRQARYLIDRGLCTPAEE